MRNRIDYDWIIIGLLCIGGALAFSSPMLSGCRRWNFVEKDHQGVWLTQDNKPAEGGIIEIWMHQRGRSLSGIARRSSSEQPALYANVDGISYANEIRLNLHWENGRSDETYEGVISLDGVINGSTYDRFRPKERVAFHSDALRCADAPAAP
jgi:hypothetical protein